MCGLRVRRVAVSYVYVSLWSQGDTGLERASVSVLIRAWC